MAKLIEFDLANIFMAYVEREDLRNMYASIDENTYEFRGSSKDKKPIGSNVPKESIDFSAHEQLKYPISTGSVFFEIDTGTTFMYMLLTDDANAVVGATWKEI